MICLITSILKVTLFLSSLVIATEEGDSWVVKYLKKLNEIKGSTYDYETSKDFIINSKYTSVFSPISSEFNLLIQASNGEYKSIASEYLDVLYKKCKQTDKEIFNVSNCVYIPEIFKDLFLDCKSDAFDFTIYNPKDSKKLIETCKSWVKEVSNDSSLNEEAFKEEFRVYASLVYFKDSWKNSFSNIGEHSFWYATLQFVKRQFIKRKDIFKYKKLKVHNLSFEVVAVPFKSSSMDFNTTRLMIYLIPRDSRDPLNLLWQKFNLKTDNDIYKFVKEMKDEEITLIIPKIDNLKSNFDLKDVLKNTYGDKLPDNIISKMYTLIKVDEEETTEESLNENSIYKGISFEKIIEVNKPHISFVYDMDLKRILFVIKDTGIEKRN